MTQILPGDNIQQHQISPPFLVDEVSSTEFYIGKSRNSSDPSQPAWRIQRIWQVGTVWNFGYPDGDQGFNFQWSNRFGYSYKQ